MSGTWKIKWILLRKISFKDYLKQFENTNPAGIEFSWEPLDGRIAASGELGFTYGIYTIKRDSVVQKGTYISVWKKDENGKWKYILDSGNEGLGE